MLKNRETASNPYHVPTRPTPGWVKASVVLLFLFVLALAGMVVYLVVLQQRCGCVATTKPDTGLRKSPQEEQADAGDQWREEVGKLFGRFERLSQQVMVANSQVARLENLHRSRDQDQPTGSSQSLTPSEVALLQKIPQIESYARGLETKLANHVEAEGRVCQPGHFQFGMYCYVIGEGSISQKNAQQWCIDDYGELASLAIIKDRWTHVARYRKGKPVSDDAVVSVRANHYFEGRALFYHSQSKF